MKICWKYYQKPNLSSRKQGIAILRHAGESVLEYEKGDALGQEPAMGNKFTVHGDDRWNEPILDMTGSFSPDRSDLSDKSDFTRVFQARTRCVAVSKCAVRGNMSKMRVDRTL